MTSWLPSWTCDVKSKIRLPQMKNIPVNSTPIRFETTEPWAFFRRNRPNKNNKNKMNSDTRPVSDLKTLLLRLREWSISFENAGNFGRFTICNNTVIYFLIPHSFFDGVHLYRLVDDIQLLRSYRGCGHVYSHWCRRRCCSCWFVTGDKLPAASTIPRSTHP